MQLGCLARDSPTKAVAAYCSNCRLVGLNTADHFVVITDMFHCPDGVTAIDLATRNMSNWRPPTDKKLRELFTLFDNDGNGVVDFEEIQENMFKYFGIRLTKEESKSMLLLYDTDESGGLCYEEFRVMINNLDSIDPESIGRYWDDVLNWFPPYKLGKWVIKKLGAPKPRHRRLVQELEATQRLFDMSKSVLNLNIKSPGKDEATKASEEQRRHTIDSAEFLKVTKNSRGPPTALRKHRGKTIVESTSLQLARKQSRGKIELNQFRPKLCPQGALSERIDQMVVNQELYHMNEAIPIGNRNSLKKLFNPRPKHWPPSSYVVKVDAHLERYKPGRAIQKTKRHGKHERYLKTNGSDKMMSDHSVAKQKRERRDSLKKQLSAVIKSSNALENQRNSPNTRTNSVDNGIAKKSTLKLSKNRKQKTAFQQAPRSNFRSKAKVDITVERRVSFAK